MMSLDQAVLIAHDQKWDHDKKTLLDAIETLDNHHGHEHELRLILELKLELLEMEEMKKERGGS